jgi:hypothetical protein
MNHFHILQKSKILFVFDIVRMIKDSEIKKIKSDIEAEKVPKKLKNKVYEDRLQKYTDEQIKVNPVPGIINRNRVSQEKVKYLLKTSVKMGQDIKKLKLSKEEESFLIVSLTKLLELSIDDFNKWKKQQEAREQIEDDEDEYGGDEEVG